MERLSLAATSRHAIGKNAVKKVRQAGLVPAVLYGRGRTPLAVAVDRRALLGALHTGAGRNVLIDLRVTRDGEEMTDTVMIADIQHDHLRRDVLHVDLHQIFLTEVVEARVPVVLAGVPTGVTEGGILEQHLRELTVRCLPTAIPEHITMNVEALHVGGSVHVRDLPATEGVEILTSPDEVIATIVAPKEEAAAPAEAPAPAEPEVVGREAAAPPEGEAKGEPAAGRVEAKAPKAEAKPAKAEKKE